MIKVLLTFSLIALALWFLQNRRTQKARAWQKVGFLMLILFALTAVLIPEVTNEIAEFVGVGRGADLLLYGLTITFIVYVVHAYAERSDDRQRLDVVVRRIALLEAEQLNSPKKKQKS